MPGCNRLRPWPHCLKLDFPATPPANVPAMAAMSTGAAGSRFKLDTGIPMYGRRETRHGARPRPAGWQVALSMPTRVTCRTGGRAGWRRPVSRPHPGAMLPLSARPVKKADNARHSGQRHVGRRSMGAIGGVAGFPPGIDAALQRTHAGIAALEQFPGHQRRRCFIGTGAIDDDLVGKRNVAGDKFAKV